MSYTSQLLCSILFILPNQNSRQGRNARTARNEDRTAKAKRAIFFYSIKKVYEKLKKKKKKKDRGACWLSQ